MVAALREWEPQVRSHSEDWITIISRGEAETLWAKLFKIVSSHSAVRLLCSSTDCSRDGMREVWSDLTQDLFLKLQEKDRWQYYVDGRYSNERVEHELFGIEVPNLISRLLRQRYPESYRLARRTSNLLMTKKEFRCFSRLQASPPSANQGTWTRSASKMVLKVYGLADWPPDKPICQQQHLRDMCKDVAHRLRDTRRAGRGSDSQVVISNTDLTQLIVDIFQTINSPADVRTMRSLVLSKLAVEDLQIQSMDAPLETAGPDPESFKADFADTRPTPEEVVLEKEMIAQMDRLAESILNKCLVKVRNKPWRFQKLIEVVWHCYFNASLTSQADAARAMEISDSLVSHYRKIFDSVLRSEDINLNECIYLNSALDRRLTDLLARYRASEGKKKRVPPPPSPLERQLKFRVVAASKK